MGAGAEGGVQEVARRLGPRARRQVPLGPRTTYRVGGAARLFLEAESEEDLELVRRAVQGTGMPVLVVGQGSNLLVSDAGFPGLALVLGEAFTTIQLPEGGGARAGGAVALPVLARRTAAAGLTGLEWAVGVPGSVGGGVRMNAGGHGSDMAAVVKAVRLVDLRAPDAAAAGLEWSIHELAPGYRSSAVRPWHVVCSAELALRPGDPARGLAEIAEIVSWRRANQPGGQNAGSVFSNPPGDSAGRLVDQAGLRGHRRGSAHVSEKHANFIQADPGGSADDVWALILEVQRLVERRLGVRLEPELRLVGFPEGESPSVNGGSASTSSEGSGSGSGGP